MSKINENDVVIAIKEQINQCDYSFGGELEKLQDQVEKLQDTVATLGVILFKKNLVTLEELIEKLPWCYNSPIKSLMEDNDE